MTKLFRDVLQALALAGLCTGIADAQITSLAPDSSPLPPMPTPMPMPSATPSPYPTPERKNSVMWHNGRGPEYFLAGDYLFSPNSKNEFNPSGSHGSDSWAARAAVEYPIGKLAVMAEGTFDHFQYTTQAGQVPVIGAHGAVFVPSFYAHNIDWDGRVGIGMQRPRIFLVASYAQRSNNYGYPNLQGFGFGIEKLPDFNAKSVSLFGSFLWYPQMGAGATLQYGFYKYQAGLEFHTNNSHMPLFLELGYMGDYGYNKQNAPTNISDNGLFAGLGVHF